MIIKNSVASSQILLESGIANGFTFSNHVWGNMRLKSSNSGTKYKKMFESLNIQSNEFLFLNVLHGDSFVEINPKNYSVFKRQEWDLDLPKDPLPTVIFADAIFTKERIPVVVTPADCSVVCISGIDLVDNKKFMAVIHIGASGLLLGIHKTVLKMLSLYYKFETKSLVASIFPGIAAKNFLKDPERYIDWGILEDSSWAKYLVFENKLVGLSIGPKLMDDLQALGIVNIDYINLDTYEQNSLGKLYSHVYQAEQKEDQKRFATVFQIQ